MMGKNKFKILSLCGISVCAIVGLLLVIGSNRGDESCSKEIVFRYARFPEPSCRAANGKTYRHELSLRSMHEMIEVLKREDFVQKVFCAVTTSPLQSELSVSRRELMQEIRGVEFMVEELPDDANRVKGRIIVRSSSEWRSRAIAEKYVALMRQLVEDESQVRIDKSTMSYYSDYHVKKKELKSLENRLLLKDIGDTDRRSVQQCILHVKSEMEKIDAEWNRQIQTLRKESGSVIEFEGCNLGECQQGVFGSEGAIISSENVVQFAVR